MLYLYILISKAADSLNAVMRSSVQSEKQQQLLVQQQQQQQQLLQQQLQINGGGVGGELNLNDVRKSPFFSLHGYKP